LELLLGAAKVKVPVPLALPVIATFDNLFSLASH
jgi:hypothetical protein